MTAREGRGIWYSLFGSRRLGKGRLVIGAEAELPEARFRIHATSLAGSWTSPLLLVPPFHLKISTHKPCTPSLDLPSLPRLNHLGLSPLPQSGNMLYHYRNPYSQRSSRFIAGSVSYRPRYTIFLTFKSNRTPMNQPKNQLFNPTQSTLTQQAL